MPLVPPSSSLLFRPLLLAALVIALTVVERLSAQPPDQAGMLLAAARRAYNEKNHAFAADRFREFLAKYGGHKDVSHARYGLGLCLLEGPTRDFDKAVESLTPLAGSKEFTEYPYVAYYLGLSRRGQGVKALEQAVLKPAEAGNLRNTARERFTEASTHFGVAVAAFDARAKDAKTPAKGLPAEVEWAARSRCDQAEMLLRTGKAREGREVVTPLVQSKELLASRYRSLGLYYHGFACSLLGDEFAAGKSLSLLSPFKDPVFGTHARYLLARVHHRNDKQDEREEARGHYQGVLADHEASKKNAQQALNQPDRFKNDPEERTRLTQLLKGPVPDHVARAMFFLGVLQYEDNRHGEALEHFKNFVTQYPDSSVASEARLRQGFCLVHLKQFPEALKLLQPLAEKDPSLADQAFYWIARAQAGVADPLKPATYAPALDSFRKAADRAQQRLTATPPDLGARTRKGEILLDLAETLQLARQPAEAATTYATVLSEKLLPAREDEVLLNQATALQLANNYNDSDKACDKFRELHPKSTLLPAVLFRAAENSYFRALAAEKTGNPADRVKEVTRYCDEAIQRYTVVVEKYPEFAHIGLARYGLGLAHYRKGDLTKARAALETIPAADRSGDLVIVSLQLAEILIRQAPARADDAVAAGKLEEALKAASEQLEAYVGAASESPAVPDALLKLGYCQQRMAKLVAEKAEKDRALAAALNAYNRLLQKYPAPHPARPLATFERAKTLASGPNVNEGIGDLRKFAQDPLNKAPIAPMALLHLATVLRGQNKAKEAVQVLEQCRKDHEAALAADASRSSWVALLQYHHAVSLREAGQLAEARSLFDGVVKSAPARVEGWESALRAGQCQKELGEKKLATATQMLSSASKPEDREKAQKLAAEAVQDLTGAVQYLASTSDTLKNQKPEGEELQKTLAATRARMLYEAAWGWRGLADREVAEAIRKAQLELWQKKRDELARKVPPGQPVPNVPQPEVALSSLPVQPAEQQARSRYRALIEAFPDVTINADARFELSELLSERGETEPAVKLLQEALEKEPGPDLTDRIKVRLGTALLDHGARVSVKAKEVLARPGLKAQEKADAEKQLKAASDDVQAALDQIQPVAENLKSSVVAQAAYREAECLLQQGKTEEAIKRLVKFRDVDPFRNIPNLTDRALLRLGAALGELKQWDASRSAYEQLLGRFGGSPWANEARYGIGWSRQNQGQFDDAVNWYSQVVGSTATRLGARAQIHIGLCRLAQKRPGDAAGALLLVPFTYDYPDLSALALMEAARALAENKQNGQATGLLRRVLRDHPDSEHAEAARKRLAELGDG